MNHRPVFLLVAFSFALSPVAFGQCAAVEFDSRSIIASDPSYVEGVALLSPGSFVGVQIAQKPPINLLQIIPHIERQLVNCYQKNTLGTAAPAFKDYSAGAGSMPVNIGRLNSGWTIGAISLGFADTPLVEVVAGNAPLQITTQTGYALPGDAITGLFVDLNKDGFADLVVVSLNENTGAGAVSILLGNGDGTFQSPVTYAAGSNSVGVTAGDFNGDGNIDLAVATQSGAASVLLLTGSGTGTFSAASPVATLPSNIFPASIASADLNGDGHLDLVLTTYSGLYILAGNGSGSFTVGPLIPLPSPATFAAVGDFNMDGKPDIAVVSPTSTVSVLLGTGAGNFASPISFLGPTSASYLVVTDVNGDGKPDIAVAQGTPSLFTADDGSGNIATLIGNGDGTFQGSRFYSTGSDATGMVAVDVNGDGKPDLVVTSSVTSFGGSANQVTTTFQTFLNQGNGTFAAPISGSSVTLGVNLAAADFNGDGKMDLAIAGANVSVLFGKGDGTFLIGANIPGVTSAGFVAAGDFNGDGKPDLLVSSGTAGFLSGPGSVTISLNNGNGTFAAPANLGGSTPIAIRSGTFNADSNPTAIVTADFNRDGKLDFVVADGGAAFDASQPGGVIVFLGNGNGTFQDATELNVGVNPTNIAVGDLNGDGILDMAISTGGTLAVTPSGYELAVLIGNGDGTFKNAVFYPVDFGPAGLAIADLNGDGKPDVVLTHCCGDLSPTYLLGNGDGTLQAEAGFKGGASPFGVIAADFNNDGKTDLALISSYGVGVLINHTPTAAFTSVSAAGFVDVPLTPNSIVSGFGAGLASGSAASTALPLPTQLAGAGISIKDSAGVTTPAGLFFASPLQVNYLVPGNVAIGPAQLSAPSTGGTLTEAIQIVPFAPSLFLLYSGNLVAGYLTRVTNGVVSTEPVYETSGTGLAPRPIPLPTGSDQLVLTVFGTGLRDYQGTFYAMVGNQFAPVLYAGTQGGFLGLDQVNIQLPSTLPSGTLPIEVGTFTGGFSNTASILIQ